MAELGDSLERMTFVQLLLLFGLVTSYVLALGGMLSTPARQRAALLALALAVAFAALTDPWVHGALLVAFVVAGLGLFVLFSWLLARVLGPREVPLESAGDSVSPSQPVPLPHGEAQGRLPELARRARATR